MKFDANNLTAIAAILSPFVVTVGGILIKRSPVTVDREAGIRDEIQHLIKNLQEERQFYKTEAEKFRKVLTERDEEIERLKSQIRTLQEQVMNLQRV